MDLSAHTAPVDSKNVKENFIADLLEVAPETGCRGDAWIHQRTQPLFTEKQRRKTESLPT
jgi:hypothetical protein